MQMTQKQYDALPYSYRGTVDGQPYALYMDTEGRTVYGPIQITDSPAPLMTDPAARAEPTPIPSLRRLMSK